METGEHHPKEPVVNQPSRISSVLRAITALTFIGGGAGELVSHHSADASTSGGNSWGAKTEQSQQINPKKHLRQLLLKPHLHLLHLPYQL